MAFRKNKKEPSRPIIEVIKYDGPSDALLWKFEGEDFNTNSRLIVGPTQEAIFVKGGQVQDRQILNRFGPGTYSLSTDNYPFIRSLVGLATGGVSPFSCCVYYVNKSISMGIDWGTNTPISYIDPVYRVPVELRSYGDFSLQVTSGLKLMEKLLGTMKSFHPEDIKVYFGEMIAVQVRGIISGMMIDRGLSPIGVDAYLPEMSAAAAEKLRPVFDPYGLELNHFAISSISAPELDAIKEKARSLQQQRMESELSAEIVQRMAQAHAFENRELNVTEQQKMASRIGETLAGNQGPLGERSGAVLFPAAQVMPAYTSGSSDIAGMIMGQSESPNAAKNAQNSFEERAQKLKFLLDKGMISQERYEEKLEELLNDI